MYNRLFQKILDSSIWLEPDHVRLVFVTMIAAMDENGVVNFACAQNVADRARVTICNAESAISVLESPDRFNPQQQHDGRRIERIEGGWLVLNAEKYRAYVNRETEKENTRQRVARHRASKKAAGKANAQDDNVTPRNDDVTPCNVTVTNPFDLISSSLISSSLEEKQKAQAAQAPAKKTKSTPVDISKLGLPPGFNSPVCVAAIELWVDHRRRIRKPLNQESLQRLIEKWRSAGPTAFIAAVNHSEPNGFVGLYSPKQESGATHGISERARRGYIAPLPSKPGDVF